MIVTNRKLFKKRPARDRLNQAAGIMASSPELMGEVQGFQNGGNVQLPGTVGSIVQMLDAVNSIQLPQITVSGRRGPNELARLRSLNEGVAISEVPVKLPSGEFGYAVYDNGQLKGYQSEPPGTPMINRSREREIDKISQEVRKEIDPSSVPRTDFSTKDLDPKLKFVNDLRKRAAETDTSTDFGEDIAAAREDAANLIEKYPSLQYLIPSELAKKGIGAVYDYFTGPSKTLQEQYDSEDAPLPIGEDIAGIASDTGRLVDEFGTERMEVFEPGVAKSVGATTEQIFDLISQGTGPKVDENVSKQFQQEVAEKEAAEQFAELNRLMAKGTGPKVPPEGRRSPQKVSEDITKGIDPKVPPEGRPEINEETKEAIVNQTDKVVQTTTGSDLDDLMQAFISKAPDYEGVDKGMAIAKIGFAIAAGKSADGIQNIADGLSMGADMLMKDDADKAAFNRQVQLSALQYGLGEISKEKAQARADARSFEKFVDKDGNPVLIPLSEIMESGGRIPKGLQDPDLYLESVKAADERLKSYYEAAKKRIDDLVLDPEQQREALEPYENASIDFQQSTNAVKLAESLLLQVADESNNITSIGSAFKDVLNKAFNAAGLDMGTEYETLAEFQADLKIAFQALIPLKLGATQSANSISDRDVDLLARAYFGTAVLAGGSFSLVGMDTDCLLYTSPSPRDS